MTQEYQLRILPEIAANEQKLKEYLSKEKGLNLRDITATRILKRSIDARQRTIFVNLKVRAYIKEMPQEDEYERTIYNNVEGKLQVIVVGAGPGGLFAALRLVELGLRPLSNAEKMCVSVKKIWHKSTGNTLLIRNRITVSEKEVQELTRMGNSIPVARREEMWIKS